MNDWFYTQNGEQVGPVSFAILKTMLASGQLGKAELVWREGMAEWTDASKVEGLLPAMRSGPPPLPSSQSRPTGPTAPPPTSSWLQRLKENPLTIGFTLFFCCFPVGLYFVWTHTIWSKWTKILWTLCFVVFVGIGMFISAQQDAALRGQLAESNLLWETGHKAAAVSKYKTLLEPHSTTIDRNEQLIMYRRIIDLAAEQGNVSEAKEFIKKSIAAGFTPPIENKKAIGMLAEVRAEVKAKAEMEARAKEKAGAGTIPNVAQHDDIRVGTSHRMGVITITRIENGRSYSLEDYQKILAVVYLRVNLNQSTNEVQTLIGVPPSYKNKMTADPGTIGMSPNANLELWAWVNNDAEDKCIYIGFDNGRVSSIQVGRETLK